MCKREHEAHVGKLVQALKDCMQMHQTLRYHLITSDEQDAVIMSTEITDAKTITHKRLIAVGLVSLKLHALADGTQTL